MATRKSPVLVKLALVAAAGMVALVVWTVWGFDVGHEARFKAEMTCRPRDGSFKSATVTVEGVVPRFQDVALEFPAEVLLIGNGGEQLRLSVRATPSLVLPDGVPGTGLAPGNAFDERAVLTCLEAVSDRAANGSADLARELLEILVATGAGPKSAPRAVKYFDIVSHSAKYL